MEENNSWGERPEDVLLCLFEDESGHCSLSYGHDEDHKMVSPHG